MTKVNFGPPALDARLSLAVGAEGSRFKVEADLSLEKGVLVLFGSSGVGKSLTLLALAGLLTPASGHVKLGGQMLLDVAAKIDVPPHKRHVGYVPQNVALFPFLDVQDNVGFGLRKRPDDVREVGRLLDELGIASLARAMPASLSGGESQRVALARALAVRPSLLLLDEPFASLDDEAREVLREVVRAVVERHAIPAVLVTHDAREAIALGQTLVRFVRGKTVESGDPRTLLSTR